MREVIIGDRTFRVRGLKRKEIKALRDRGFVLLALEGKDLDAAQDATFEMVFSKEELAAIDELDNRDALRLWDAILRETSPAADEVKN